MQKTISYLTPPLRKICDAISARGSLRVGQIGTGESFSDNLDPKLIDRFTANMSVNFGTAEKPYFTDVLFRIEELGVPVHDIAVLKNADTDNDLELMYTTELILRHAALRLAAGGDYHVSLRPIFVASDKGLVFEITCNDHAVAKLTCSWRETVHVLSLVQVNYNRDGVGYKVDRGINRINDLTDTFSDSDWNSLPPELATLLRDYVADTSGAKLRKGNKAAA